MDYSAYAGYIVPAVAFLSLALSLHNFFDKYIKEHYPKVVVRLNVEPLNMNNITLSVTNNGLRTVVLCSYRIRIVKPHNNEKLIRAASSGFNAYNIIEQRLPFELAPNKPFVVLIDMFEMFSVYNNCVPEPHGDRFRFDYQVVFSDNNGKKYASNMAHGGITFVNKHHRFHKLQTKIDIMLKRL